MRNRRILGLGATDRFSLVANCNPFCRVADKYCLSGSHWGDLVQERARQKKGNLVEGVRCYKNVTRKTGSAALKLRFLCILQLNRAVKSEIIRLK
jgi:hypothetical protein